MWAACCCVDLGDISKGICLRGVHPLPKIWTVLSTDRDVDTHLKTTAAPFVKFPGHLPTNQRVLFLKSVYRVNERG